MPIYEFVCSSCSREFEQLVLGSRNEVRCPKCGCREVQKKMSAFAYKSGYKFVGTGKGTGGGCSGCSSSNCSSCGG